MLIRGRFIRTRDYKHSTRRAAPHHRLKRAAILSFMTLKLFKMERLAWADYDIVILCHPDNFAFMGVVRRIAISTGITLQNNTSTETMAV